MSPQPKAVENHIPGQSNKPLSKPPHALSWEAVADELRANVDDGLISGEAETRLEEYGHNDLGNGNGVSPGKILVRQIANAMTLVLILAMAVSFGIASYIEGGVVLAVIAINIMVGFVQEFQAEKTMDSLRSLSSPTSSAVRDGKSVTVATVGVVPGDLVEMKAGDTIPADVRITEAINFETDEALLTGESLPVRKSAKDIYPDVTSPGDRCNVAYSSSTVTKGRATGIVFATGLHTEIGSIAAALRKKNSKVRSVKVSKDGTKKPHRYLQAAVLTVYDGVENFLGINVGTPLQRRLSQLALLLFGIAIICAVIVLGANDFRKRQEVIIYAVATGLSMIPASLVVVLTITMAAGTKRMVERHVIVRSLKSLEALGGVTDICSDKTGTLTQGKMVAKKAWIPARGTFTVGESNNAIDPTAASVTFSEKQPKEMTEKDISQIIDRQDMSVSEDALQQYLRVASLANLAVVHQTEDQEWHARGDPTEIAIQVFAARFNRNRRDSVSGDFPAWKMLAEFPFDSDVKRMSVLYQDLKSQGRFVFTRGAVERVVASCTSFINKDDSAKEMTEKDRDSILENTESLAKFGLRVLAFASCEYSGEYTEGVEIDR